MGVERGEIFAKLMEIFNRNRGKTIGVLIGFLVSIFFLWLGFWRTLFIVVCCSAGYAIGTKVDNREDFRDLIDRILPPHE